MANLCAHCLNQRDHTVDTLKEKSVIILLYYVYFIVSVPQGQTLANCDKSKNTTNHTDGVQRQILCMSTNMEGKEKICFSSPLFLAMSLYGCIVDVAIIGFYQGQHVVCIVLK